MTRHDAKAALITAAVKEWYDFYDVKPDDQASEALCNAALGFIRSGHETSDDVATLLIGLFVGKWSTRVNAPTSHAVH